MAISTFGLYDNEGSRIARPSDAEVARYANNAYNREGISRRDFLYLAGAAALSKACSKNGNGCPTCPSGDTYRLTGNVTGTFGGEPLENVTGTFGGEPLNIAKATLSNRIMGSKTVDVNGSRYEIDGIVPEVYEFALEGGGVQTRRVRSGVIVSGNANLDMDAIERPFNWQHSYKVDSSGARFDVGHFVIKALRTDRNGDVQKLVGLYPEISRELLSAEYGGIVFDTSSAREGDIFVHWDDPIPGGHGSSVTFTMNGRIIKWAEIFVKSMTPIGQLRHEGARALGFGGDGGRYSIFANLGAYDTILEDDKDAVVIKYKRNLGWVAAANIDKD